MIRLSNPNGKHWPHNLAWPVTITQIIERMGR